MTDVKTILTKAIETGASDIHINVGLKPVIRKNTELIDLSLDPVTDEDAKEMVLNMVGQDRFATFQANRDLDFSTTLGDGHRFRVNAHYQRDTIAISFRIVPNQIPRIDQLNLPPIVTELTNFLNLL